MDSDSDESFHSATDGEEDSEKDVHQALRQLKRRQMFPKIEPNLISE